MAEDKSSEGFRPLRSVTRLLVGGLILGSDALQGRLQNWEQQDDAGLSAPTEGATQPSPEFDPLPENLPPPGLTSSLQHSSTNLRYALIGLIFTGEEQLERGLALTQRVVNFAGRVTDPLIQPLTRIPNPAAKSLDRLVQRGQVEVDRWVDRGREEETNSRQLAQEAATSTVDESISYMAQNPALEALIQQQSVSLARQILALVRSLSVSSDYFFEGLIRYTLRRKPRYLLPLPSPEVQEQATWTLQDIRHEELNGNE